MLVIQRLRRTGPAALVMILGAVLMATGASMDVIGPLLSAGHEAHVGPGEDHTAHLVAIAGMALVLAGVVIHGARRPRRARAARHGGLDTHALR